MSSLEKEIQELQEKNKELVRAAQNWKMEAGEKDKDILRLTKEVNDLRIQLSVSILPKCCFNFVFEAGIKKRSFEIAVHLIFLQIMN